MNEQMSYEQFRVEAVQKIVEHCRLEDTPERVYMLTDGYTSDDPDMAKDIDETNKKYGHAGADCLVGDFVFLKVRQPNQKDAVCRFDVKYLYKEYRSRGWERIREIVDKNVETAASVDMSVFDTITDYGATKDKLILCLRNRSNFKVRYGDFVFQRFDDMAMMLYVIMNDDGRGDRLITPVFRKQFESWGKDEDFVLGEALQNTARISPPRMYMSLADMSGRGRDRGDFMDPLKPLMKIPTGPMGATVSAMPNDDGAVAMFYPGVQERISMMAGGDYYVVFTGKDEAHIHIPSTVSVKLLREVLWDSNHHFPQDMLTANVYFYDHRKKKLRKV